MTSGHWESLRRGLSGVEEGNSLALELDGPAWLGGGRGSELIPLAPGKAGPWAVNSQRTGPAPSYPAYYLAQTGVPGNTFLQGMDSPVR